MRATDGAVDKAGLQSMTWGDQKLIPLLPLVTAEKLSAK